MKVAVIRFSALGDILILLPLLKKLQREHEGLEITMVSRPYLAPLFVKQGLGFFAADIDKKYRGLPGLNRLASALRRELKPELIIDQHQVLRTQILGAHFKLSRVPFFQIRKDRPGRKALTAYPDKRFAPLTPVYEQYRQTFAKAGFTFSFDPARDAQITYALDPATQKFWQENKSELNIAVAPLAKHDTKIWPLEKQAELWRGWEDASGLKLWFLGGPAERQVLEDLARNCGQDYVVLAGRFKLDQEMALLAQMNAALTMDSSNMHLAALSGIPVVSVWGSTHPYAGFAPYGANEKGRVQIPHEELDCRPCSIFGAKPCFRGDHACMQWISPQQVAEKLRAVL